MPKRKREFEESDFRITCQNFIKVFNIGGTT